MEIAIGLDLLAREGSANFENAGGRHGGKI
jgi:hypothetical protein